MTMNPSTWLSVDPAMQRMGSLKHERLGQFVHTGISQ